MDSSSFELLKNQFQLDPNFVYLNHGSFGACPKPIFEERNKWQIEIEKQPVSFIEDKAIELLDWSRQELASFINCDKDDVVYFPNPTTAMNMVIKSLNLKPGDEVLSFSLAKVAHLFLAAHNFSMTHGSPGTCVPGSFLLNLGVRHPTKKSTCKKPILSTRWKI